MVTFDWSDLLFHQVIDSVTAGSWLHYTCKWVYMWWQWKRCYEKSKSTKPRGKIKWQNNTEKKTIWNFSFIVLEFLTYIHSIYTTINCRLIENTGNHANITLYFNFMSFFQSIVSVILITDHCTTPTIKKTKQKKTPSPNTLWSHPKEWYTEQAW